MSWQINNADYFRDKWIAKSTNFKAAPMCGMYFPGNVVLYPEWLLGIDAPFNGLASAYLSSWYGSAHDESCMASTHIGEHHRCWDASYLYNHVDTRLFMAQNRFDYSISQDVLLCPYGHLKNNHTKTFIGLYLYNFGIFWFNLTREPNTVLLRGRVLRRLRARTFPGEGGNAPGAALQPGPQGEEKSASFGRRGTLFDRTYFEFKPYY